jgi:hypothetical protein
MAKKEKEVNKKVNDVVVVLKPNNHFKLPGTVKRVMASIDDPHARGAYKRAMISAELSYQANKKKRLTRSDVSKDE